MSTSISVSRSWLRPNSRRDNVSADILSSPPQPRRMHNPLPSLEQNLTSRRMVSLQPSSEPSSPPLPRSRVPVTIARATSYRTNNESALPAPEPRQEESDASTPASLSPAPYYSTPFKRNMAQAVKTTTIPLRGWSEDDSDNASKSFIARQTPAKRGRPRKSAGTPMPARKRVGTPAKSRAEETKTRRLSDLLGDGSEEGSEEWDFNVPQNVSVRRGRSGSSSQARAQSQQNRFNGNASVSGQRPDLLEEGSSDLVPMSSRANKRRREPLSPEEKNFRGSFIGSFRDSTYGHTPSARPGQKKARVGASNLSNSRINFSPTPSPSRSEEMRSSASVVGPREAVADEAGDQSGPINSAESRPSTGENTSSKISEEYRRSLLEGSSPPVLRKEVPFPSLSPAPSKRHNREVEDIDNEDELPFPSMSPHRGDLTRSTPRANNSPANMGHVDVFDWDSDSASEAGSENFGEVMEVVDDAMETTDDIEALEAELARLEALQKEGQYTEVLNQSRRYSNRSNEKTGQAAPAQGEDSAYDDALFSIQQDDGPFVGEQAAVATTSAHDPPNFQGFGRKAALPKSSVLQTVEGRGGYEDVFDQDSDSGSEAEEPMEGVGVVGDEMETTEDIEAMEAELARLEALKEEGQYTEVLNQSRRYSHRSTEHTAGKPEMRDDDEPFQIQQDNESFVDEQADVTATPAHDPPSLYVFGQKAALPRSPPIQTIEHRGGYESVLGQDGDSGSEAGGPTEGVEVVGVEMETADDIEAMEAELARLEALKEEGQYTEVLNRSRRHSNPLTEHRSGKLPVPAEGEYKYDEPFRIQQVDEPWAKEQVHVSTTPAHKPLSFQGFGRKAALPTSSLMQTIEHRGGYENAFDQDSDSGSEAEGPIEGVEVVGGDMETTEDIAAMEAELAKLEALKEEGQYTEVLNQSRRYSYRSTEHRVKKAVAEYDDKLLQIQQDDLFVDEQADITTTPAHDPLSLHAFGLKLALPLSLPMQATEHDNGGHAGVFGQDSDFEAEQIEGMEIAEDETEKTESIEAVEAKLARLEALKDKGQYKELPNRSVRFSNPPTGYRSGKVPLQSENKEYNEQFQIQQDDEPWAEEKADVTTTLARDPPSFHALGRMAALPHSPFMKTIEDGGGYADAFNQRSDSDDYDDGPAPLQQGKREEEPAVDVEQEDRAMTLGDEHLSSQAFQTRHPLRTSPQADYQPPALVKGDTELLSDEEDAVEQMVKTIESTEAVKTDGTIDALGEEQPGSSPTSVREASPFEPRQALQSFPPPLPFEKELVQDENFNPFAPRHALRNSSPAKFRGSLGETVELQQREQIGEVDEDVIPIVENSPFKPAKTLKRSPLALPTVEPENANPFEARQSLRNSSPLKFKEAVNPFQARHSSGNSCPIKHYAPAVAEEAEEEEEKMEVVENVAEDEDEMDIWAMEGVRQDSNSARHSFSRSRRLSNNSPSRINNRTMSEEAEEILKSLAFHTEDDAKSEEDYSNLSRSLSRSFKSNARSMAQMMESRDQKKKSPVFESSEDEDEDEELEDRSSPTMPAPQRPTSARRSHSKEVEVPTVHVAPKQALAEENRKEQQNDNAKIPLSRAAKRSLSPAKEARTSVDEPKKKCSTIADLVAPSTSFVEAVSRKAQISQPLAEREARAPLFEMSMHNRTSAELPQKESLKPRERPQPMFEKVTNPFAAPITTEKLSSIEKPILVSNSPVVASQTRPAASNFSGSITVAPIVVVDIEPAVPGPEKPQPNPIRMRKMSDRGSSPIIQSPEKARVPTTKRYSQRTEIEISDDESEKTGDLQETEDEDEDSGFSDPDLVLETSTPLQPKGLGGRGGRVSVVGGGLTSFTGKMVNKPFKLPTLKPPEQLIYSSQPKSNDASPGAGSLRDDGFTFRRSRVSKDFDRKSDRRAPSPLPRPPVSPLKSCFKDPMPAPPSSPKKSVVFIPRINVPAALPGASTPESSEYTQSEITEEQALGQSHSAHVDRAEAAEIVVSIEQEEMTELEQEHEMSDETGESEGGSGEESDTITIRGEPLFTRIEEDEDDLDMSEASTAFESATTSISPSVSRPASQSASISRSVSLSASISPSIPRSTSRSISPSASEVSASASDTSGPLTISPSPIPQSTTQPAIQTRNYLKPMTPDLWTKAHWRAMLKIKNEYEAALASLQSPDPNHFEADATILTAGHDGGLRDELGSAGHIPGWIAHSEFVGQTIYGKEEDGSMDVVVEGWMVHIAVLFIAERSRNSSTLSVDEVEFGFEGEGWHGCFEHVLSRFYGLVSVERKCHAQGRRAKWEKPVVKKGMVGRWREVKGKGLLGLGLGWL